MEDLNHNFLKYLSKTGISPDTLKNYKSDLKHFAGWIILKIRSWGVIVDTFEEAVPYLSTKIAEEYRLYLVGIQIPAKTINRRLATLRHLARFLIEENLLSGDFTQNIANVVSKKLTRKTYTKTNEHEIDHLVDSFEKYLSNQKISQNTIKNYLSDIKHFAGWYKEVNHG